MPRSAPTNWATKSSAGRAQDLLGRVVLREHAALAQDRDAIAHLDRLVDVVGDEHDRLLHFLLQAQELVLQAGAVDRVDRAERLVHQHQRRVGRERARHADALALAARQLRRVAAAELLGLQADQSPAAPPRARRCGSSASRAAWARSRCSRRPCSAGTARSAGSRSRSRAAARARRAPARCCPPSRISPPLSDVMRLISRIVVVFPQPDGPTSTQKSPAGTVKERSPIAGSRSPG